VRGLLLTAALVVVVVLGWIGDSSAINTCHPTMTTTALRANLDRDRTHEEITTTNVSCDHEYAYGVRDFCEHRWASHWLNGTGLLDSRRVLQANGVRDGMEFFYVLRRSDHRAPDLGTAALVHLVKLAPRKCASLRYLFRYQAAEPLLPPPGGSTLVRFDVALTELSSRYRGTEIRLIETFEHPSGDKRRTTLLRYSRLADRYVVYSPKL
jgi:hypothetical protein